MEIDEISGVDHPAHLVEGWMVMKSLRNMLNDQDPDLLSDDRESTYKEGQMPDDFDISGLPEDAQAYVERLKQAKGGDNSADLNAVNEAIEKAREQWDSDLQSLTASQDVDSLDPAVVKALAGVSADVRKALESEINKAREEAEEARKAATAEREIRERSEAIAKARVELSNVGDPSLLGPALAEIAKAAPESANIIEEVLKQVNGQLDTAKMFDELGSGVPGPSKDSPEARLDSLAKARVAKAEGSVDYNTAYSEVLDTAEGRSLYDQIIGGR